MEHIFSTIVAVDQVSAENARALMEIESWLAGRVDATPFHRPAWVCAVARGCGQEAMFLVARDVTRKILGLLPLNIVHSPLFGRALVSVAFAVDGAAYLLAERRCCPTVELRGGVEPGIGWTLRRDAYLGFARPLAASDEEELLAIPKRHRAEVRKALDARLDISVGREERHRAIHYALYRRSVHALGTPVFPRAMFDEVMDAFGDRAEIMIASKDDRPLSAVLSLYHGDRVMPYWHGAIPESRRFRSNEALYFTLMRHARERGCTIFDFGRSKVGTGPALWKKTWGFTPEPLAYHVRALPGHVARDINPLSPGYRRKVELWKRLPTALVDRIGPPIARGLG
jgi:FemAB-related protein (PEP-CTERM system-associated)